MKRLVAETGGRPRANDDLMALQEMIIAGSGSPLLVGLPTCVVSGCAVTPSGTKYNIAPGLVWLGPGVGTASGLYDFTGATNVELPATFLLGPTRAIDQRPYQTGGTKTCISDTKAELDGIDDGPGVAVYPEGPVMWYDHVAARTRAIGLVEFGFFDLTGYDQSGQGLGRNRGWQLLNGQNGTNANYLGRVPLIRNPNRTDYDTAGKTGGSESVVLDPSQMPTHIHTLQWAGSHTHTYGDRYGQEEDTIDAGSNRRRSRDYTETKTTGYAGDHTHTMDPAGGGLAHENRPPYVVMVARQWMGLS